MRVHRDEVAAVGRVKEAQRKRNVEKLTGQQGRYLRSAPFYNLESEAFAAAMSKQRNDSVPLSAERRALFQETRAAAPQRNARG